VIVRKEIQSTDQKLVQKVVNFDKLEEYKEVFKGHTAGFSCLGTTRADAGSAEMFIKIDHDYTFECARLLKELNSDCKDLQFHLLTAGGSNKNSWLLYPKTKGLLEEHVKELEFPKLVIYRPGLLTYDEGKHY
jgi:oxidoreductase